VTNAADCVDFPASACIDSRAPMVALTIKSSGYFGVALKQA
jgi:hypothetical protein